MSQEKTKEAMSMGVMMPIPKQTGYVPEVDHEEAMIAAYKKLCDAVFDVLTMPCLQRIKEAKEYEEHVKANEERIKNMPLPSFMTIDHTGEMMRQRDMLRDQIEKIHELEEPIHTYALAVILPPIQNELDRIERQIDTMAARPQEGPQGL